MVNFVKEASPVNSPQSVNASRGLPANRAFETLFSGLGRTLGQAAKAVDENNLQNIQQEVSGEINQAASGGGLFQENTPADPGAPQNIIPTEIKNAQGDLARLSKAQAQRTISDTEFFARANSTASRLKARYPSYSGEIDKIISSTIGGSTANSLRKAQLREQKAQLDRLDKRQKRRDTLEKDGSDLEMHPNQMARLNDDQLEFAVNERRFVAAKIKHRKAKLAVDAAQNLENSGEALRELREQLNTAYNFGIEGVTASLFGSRQEFEKKLKEAGQDGKFSDEEISTLVDGMNVLDGDLDRIFESLATSPLVEGGTESLSTLINNTGELTALKKEFIGRNKRIRELVENKDFGVLNRENTLFKAQQNRKLRTLQEHLPGFANSSAMKETLGDQTFSVLLSQNSKLQKLLNEEADQAVQMILGGALNPDSAAGLGDGLNAAGVLGLDPKVHSAALEKMSDMLASPGLTKEGFGIILDKAYNNKLLSTLGQYKASNRQDIFLKLVSPEVTANVQRFAKSERFNQYKAFVEEGFKTLYQADLGVLQEGIEEAQGVEFLWNKTTKQFVPRATTPELNALQPATIIFEAAKNIRAGKAVTRINSFLQRYAPIIEAGGGQNQEVSDGLIELMQRVDPSINPSAPKTGTILDRMLQSMGEVLAPLAPNSEDLQNQGFDAEGASSISSEPNVTPIGGEEEIGDSSISSEPNVTPTGGQSDTGPVSLLPQGVVASSVMNPLIDSLDGASRLTKKGADDRLKETLAGPMAALSTSFSQATGKEVVINDAIAKKGTSRERSTPGSRHFHGDALDLAIGHLSPEEQLELFRQAKQAGFTGFGFGKGILHVDRGAKRAWAYGNSQFGQSGVSTRDLIKEAKQ
jgi:hypothetical protein